MKLYLLIVILLIGCSSTIDRRSGGTTLYQYNRDKARCEMYASDITRTIKRDTFMQKLGYYLFDPRTSLTRECLHKRGYSYCDSDDEDCIGV